MLYKQSKQDDPESVGLGSSAAQVTCVSVKFSRDMGRTKAWCSGALGVSGM